MKTSRISLKDVIELIRSALPVSKPQFIRIPNNGAVVGVFKRCEITECESETTRWNCDWESGTPICPECGRDLPFSHWEIDLTGSK